MIGSKRPTRQRQPEWFLVWLAGLYEEARRVRHERALGHHEVVHLAEPREVCLDGESRNHPNDHPQEEDHGADVVELKTQLLQPQIGDFQSGILRGLDIEVGVASEPNLFGLFTQKVLDDFKDAVRANMLRQATLIAAPGRSWSCRLISDAASAAGSTNASTPFLKQFSKKMSPNHGPMTQRKP